MTSCLYNSFVAFSCAGSRFGVFVFVGDAVGSESSGTSSRVTWEKDNASSPSSLSSSRPISELNSSFFRISCAE